MVCRIALVMLMVEHGSFWGQNPTFQQEMPESGIGTIKIREYIVMAALQN